MVLATASIMKLWFSNFTTVAFFVPDHSCVCERKLWQEARGEEAWSGMARQSKAGQGCPVVIYSFLLSYKVVLNDILNFICLLILAICCFKKVIYCFDFFLFLKEKQYWKKKISCWFSQKIFRGVHILLEKAWKVKSLLLGQLTPSANPIFKIILP